MVRKPRLEVEGGLYHINHAARTGRMCFASDDDHGEVPVTPFTAKAANAFFLYAYCLMTNHLSSSESGIYFVQVETGCRFWPKSWGFSPIMAAAKNFGTYLKFSDWNCFDKISPLAISVQKSRSRPWPDSRAFVRFELRAAFAAIVAADGERDACEEIIQGWTRRNPRPGLLVLAGLS